MNLSTRIFDHNILFRTTARRAWTDVKYFKRQDPWSRHLVWGKLSFGINQDHLEEILVHKWCNGEIKDIGEDGISFCTECETIVEGDTEYMTLEEFEKR